MSDTIVFRNVICGPRNELIVAGSRLSKGIELGHRREQPTVKTLRGSQGGECATE